MFDIIYNRPWCRIGPYLVGMICGAFLYRTECKMKLNKVKRRQDCTQLPLFTIFLHLNYMYFFQYLRVLCWLVAIPFATTSVFGLYNYTRGVQELSVGVSALYNSAHRTAWGIALSWLIYACVTGHGCE